MSRLASARRRHLARAASFALVAALSGCRDTSGPPPEPRPEFDVYFLRTVAGDPLPIRVTRADGTEWDLGVELVALKRDGGFTLTTSLVPAGQSQSSAPGASFVLEGRYTMAGTQITLRFTCAAPTGCPANWVGTRTTDSLVVAPVTDPAAERVYLPGLEL